MGAPIHAAVGRRRQWRVLHVRDANGQAVSYVYYEQEPGRRTAAGLLTRDEARHNAINMAKMPELLRQPQ
jgi:YD repeat-containing protein